MRFKNYKNPYTKNNRIYSKSDVANMTVKDVFGSKQELMAQNRSIGLPSDRELMNSENVVWVESYTRDDGTEVKAHYRSKPGHGSIGDENTGGIFDSAITYPFDEKSKKDDVLEDYDLASDEDENPVVAWVNIALEIAKVLFKDTEVGKVLETISPLAQIILPMILEDDDTEEEQTEPVTNREEKEEKEKILPKEENSEHGDPTGGASGIKEEELERIVKDNINNVNNTLYNEKSETIKNIEDEIINKDILTTKPEYKSLLYKYFIDVNNDKNKNNPDAQELMNISLIGPKNLPKSIEYKILPYGTGEKEINKLYNIDTHSNKYVPKDYFGVEFADYSSLSKNLSNSKILQEQIKNQYDTKAGKFKSNVIEIDLTNDNQNLQYSIGHCTIFNPHMTSDGTFTGDGFDMYNYNYIKPNGSSTIDLNNKAYFLQCAGIIKNYYIKVPIRFKIQK